jgi:hypothetical protein
MANSTAILTIITLALLTAMSMVPRMVRCANCHQTATTGLPSPWPEMGSTPTYPHPLTCPRRSVWLETCLSPL